MANDSDKRTFWNARATGAEHPGTNDYLLKSLELDLLKERIPRGAYVLDAGCGDGSTLVTLAAENDCTGVGFDFSENMLSKASQKAHERNLGDRVRFVLGTLQAMPEGLGGFGAVITERSLINLSGTDEQHAAFSGLMQMVAPGGRYFMIESSVQGLERTNALRLSLGLEAIAMPWHNAFLDEDAVAGWSKPGIVLDEVFPFSSTYYLLSRVVYARLAADSGEALRYDSPINLISTRLPVLGDYGPTRLWVWRKA